MSNDNVIDFPRAIESPESEGFALSPEDMERIFEMSEKFTAMVEPSPKYAIGNLFGAVHTAQLSGITREEFIARTEEIWSFIEKKS